MHVTGELRKADDCLGHPPISHKSSHNEMMDNRWAQCGEEGTGWRDTSFTHSFSQSISCAECILFSGCILGSWGANESQHPVDESSGSPEAGVGGSPSGGD